MHDENEDPVWRLIGRVERPAAPPFFVPKTVRRATASGRTRGLPSFFLGWKFGGLAAAAAAVMLLFWQLAPRPNPHLATGESSAFTDTQMADLADDFEMIAHLDNLLAEEEQQLWSGSYAL